jgi:RHS repeat-associated protein
MMLSAVCASASSFSLSRSTGKERDTESGNDYFEARYYASSMGRFMSPDWSAKEEPVPYANLDDPQSLNLYAYVRNNPLARVDVDGHVDWDSLIVSSATAAGMFAGALIGGGGGASGGTLVCPGFGTIAGGYEGAVVGGAGGALVGAAVGKGIVGALDYVQSKSHTQDSSSSSEGPKEEPSQLKAGKEAHAAEEVRPGEKAEVRTPDGKGRMDRYDAGKGHIREIKPDNARGASSGKRQLSRYKAAMEKATEKPHTTELTTYQPKKP